MRNVFKTMRNWTFKLREKFGERRKKIYREKERKMRMREKRKKKVRSDCEMCLHPNEWMRQ